MTDVDNNDLNKHVLENMPVSDKILDENSESGQQKCDSVNTDSVNTTSQFVKEEPCVSASVEDKTLIEKDEEQGKDKTFEHTNNCKEDILEDVSQNSEQQEEDVPENFFDDFMSEDFIEGLNVVDTWEGDDIQRTDIPTDVIEKENEIDISKLKPEGSLNTNKQPKGRSSKEKQRKEKKNKKNRKDREIRPRMVRSNSRNKQQNRFKPSRNSRSRSPKNSDSKTRRDPSKTQRDILRDKDKCEKDKNTKIIHEKLKVVETGLVPPGMEMEVEVQNTTKVTKLEEGEIVDKETNVDKHRKSKILENKNNKSLRTESARYSLSKKSVVGKRNFSPEHRREHKRIRSRSRSNKQISIIKSRSRSKKRLPSLSRNIKRLRSRSRSAKRLRSRSRSIKRLRSRSRSIKRLLRSRSRSIKRRYSRDRSLSIGRRMERRKNNLRRTRSRSMEFLEKYRHRSPLRKTSPLVKRNQELFREIDKLKATLNSNDRIIKLLSPVSRNIEHDLSNKHINMSNMDTSQNFIGNAQLYAPVPPPNQNFIPLQPVPPPQPNHVELDQQFFIGQPVMEPNNPFSVPMSQPPMLHNREMQSNMQHDFQQNWIMDQPPPPANFFNPNSQFNMEPNMYQASMCPPPVGQTIGTFMGPPMEFIENPGNMMLQEQYVPFLPQEATEQIKPTIPVANFDHGVGEEELFAKLFADNKITLSDYLSVTAKSTDNSNPVDLQNKIKVISHCQEVLNEITGRAKSSGKFFLHKSQKSVNRAFGEGVSPFKKVPAIKFQFTTYSKQVEEKPQLATYLNRLMQKLRKDVSFQEVVQVPPSTPTPKAEPIKESSKNRRGQRTSNAYVQTEAVSVSDFGCQVSFDDISSPTKSILKKQSLAKLTPAQLLAQAEKEAPPPPAPRWSTFSEAPVNRRTDIYWDPDEMDRRNFQSSSGWTIPTRNIVETPNFADHSSKKQLFYGKRH